MFKDTMKENLKNFTYNQIVETIKTLGEPSFRAKQVYKWIYQQRVDSFSKMENMPKLLRSNLEATFTVENLTIDKIIESSKGDAVKFGFALPDSPFVIESVILIDGKRRTACVSSQLGCGLGCVFCETGKIGFIRNLSQSEILGQLIGMNNFLAQKDDKLITNVVFMGMGEALSNYQNFRSSLEIIMSEDAFNIGARRITVSTAGVIPSIEKLMQEDLTIGLAISLNSYSNSKRDKIMPINKKYPIEQLIDMAKRYYHKTGRMVTFEYVLIENETDTPQALNGLHMLLHGIPCKVNLIPINPYTESKFKTPGEKRLFTFVDQLNALGITTTIRTSRGRDISGACGQLSAKQRSTKNLKFDN